MTAGCSAARQSGSGWLEISVALVVIGALVAALLEAVLRSEELAEKAMVDATVRNLRSGLRWRVAESMLRSGGDDLDTLAGSNPVRWLERPPAGYLGDFSPPPARIARGSWYFDGSTRELAYRPALAFHFEPEPGRPAEIRWRVRALRGGTTGFAAEGLVLVETTRYRWF